MVCCIVFGVIVIDVVDDLRFVIVVDVLVIIYGYFFECEVVGFDGMWVYIFCVLIFWELNCYFGMLFIWLCVLGLLLWWYYIFGLLYWVFNFWFD